MTRTPSPRRFTTKAVILSAFVFPGLGLWWLKHYGRALIFIAPAGGALGWILHTMISVYRLSLDQLQGEGDAILYYDMTQLVSHIYSILFKNLEAYNASLHTLEIIFLAAWLCGLVSTYFVGQQRDQQEQQTTTKETHE